MEERVTQAHEGAGGGASARALGVALLGGVTLVAMVLPSASFGADQTVSVGSNFFSPRNVTVGQGERVTWMNTSGSHNVVFDDGSFTAPPSDDPSNWTRFRDFNVAPGTYGYYCVLHGGPGGVGMSGTVTVSGGTPPPAPPPPPAPAPPGTPPAPPPKLRVSLKVSDRTPRPGQRVRFSGLVRPQQDRSSLLIQRRKRNGRFKTVARTRLKDAGARKSAYSRRLRLFRDGVFRARVPKGATHSGAISRTRRVNVL
jgi:plastocyanin